MTSTQLEIVDTKEECYLVFGIIHDMFKPMVGRVKDYITDPKSNMYRSLHTTVISDEGVPFEVQIRTWEMHKNAEYGIAAHWKYKEKVTKNDVLFDKRIAWFRNIIEAQKTSNDVENIVELIKEQHEESVIVMTPKLESVTLPKGATVIDFAYRIHTQVGHRATGAKVNNSIVPLDYQLQDGDIVEIITSKDKSKGPNRAWLNFAITSEAKNKIKAWFKKEKREENIVQGKTMLEREFSRNMIRIPAEKLVDFLGDDLKRYSCATLDDYFASIGYGGIILSKIMPRLKTRYDKLYAPSEKPVEVPQTSKKSNSNKSHGIVFKNGLDDCEIKISQCCSPMPYDKIVGFITRGKGVSIHKVTCPNYKSALKKGVDMGRWIEANWVESKSEYFQANIEIIATDRIGLVYDITSIMMQSRIMIKHSSSGMLKNKNAIFRASIFIASLEQLNTLFDKLKKVNGVISVNRV
jgi:GTP pyrophosphokinase